ncbi:hypothetical protein A2303_03770 [Candidatus Falkowbacteria bacterium RIFOXYB2_FULL_47_14]|uniref:Uncharacterized protein n=1 Tax=Candidatus Falkowbacteria bacterium RIFOXYA2_FULL_47_19 TaxID=1797994 RepID=A0A1F5SHU1_9BACT|nr:MAG: hypothetical protein A2227_03315 [Candidatus Falkowbacteria bacterium RIFOXYA2_FULL_47_19]OGF37262.1 MAG: hypothetical protein A2468_06610 [Candidatus Falkowbacteria bacterium RIFOXYC2_FULL_46_15]OGF42514.1 MAG: hypothetical protein A2303_03770 [Candidatus Falkowbacteria bacterium RIFOXYB2_FULL_47_14]
MRILNLKKSLYSLFLATALVAGGTGRAAGTDLELLLGNNLRQNRNNESGIERLRREVKDALKTVREMNRVREDLGEIERRRSKTERLKIESENELDKARGAEQLEDNIDRLKKIKIESPYYPESEIPGNTVEGLINAGRQEKISSDAIISEKNDADKKPIGEERETVGENTENPVPGKNPPAATENIYISPEKIEGLKNEAALRAGYPQANFSFYFNPVDWNVGSKFEGFGIATDDPTADLDLLLAVIKEPFPDIPRLAPLSADPQSGLAFKTGIGTGDGTVYKGGSFIVLGGPGLPINEGVKFVLINDVYYGAIPVLASVFPEVEFIRANRANEKLKTALENGGNTVK